MTGMRRGEILGLGWSDLDLDAGRVAVRPPRNSGGLPGAGVAAEDGQGLPLACSGPGDGGGAACPPRSPGRGEDSELVFTGPDGTAVHPERFSDWFRQHVAAAGLRRIRLHDVRHGYASAAEALDILSR